MVCIVKKDNGLIGKRKGLMLILLNKYKINIEHIFSNFAGGNISTLEASDSDMYFDFVTTISSTNIKNLKNIVKFNGKPLPSSGYQDIIYKVRLCIIKLIGVLLIL